MSTYTLRDLGEVVRNTKQLLLGSTDDGDTIDILGHISSVEKGLANLRRGTQVEFEDGQAGDVFYLDRGRRSVNSYNTPRLITDFAQAMGKPLWETFIQLWRSDVLRITWQHTNLTRLASEEGLTLVTAPHEITEGDEAHIGTYWKDGYATYKPVD